MTVGVVEEEAVRRGARESKEGEMESSINDRREEASSARAVCVIDDVIEGTIPRSRGPFKKAIDAMEAVDLRVCGNTLGRWTIDFDALMK